MVDTGPGLLGSRDRLERKSGGNMRLAVVSESGEQVNNAASVRRDKKSRRDGAGRAGQGRVRCRYYRSWGAAGPTVQKCKRFGSNDDASPRIAAGEEGRGGEGRRGYPTRKHDLITVFSSRLQFQPAWTRNFGKRIHYI
jgi:hypothetical protein